MKAKSQRTVVVISALLLLNTLRAQNDCWHFNGSGYTQGTGCSAASEALFDTDKPRFNFNDDVKLGTGVLLTTSQFKIMVGALEAIHVTASNIGLFNSNPDGNTRLVLNSTEMNGFVLNHSSATSYRYGLLVKTNNAYTKVFAHMDGSNTEDFLIWGNGVVDIKKLYATEIEVRPDAMGIYWPDYVFDQKYNFLSIEQLKNYMDAKHHLPHFPSAASVNEKGYVLTETMTALLMTVEEQTLYIIQLDQRIKELEAQNQETNEY